ncbi:MAG: TatD family nuclease-associated radical SAM protein [Clostridiales bacterium]|nr:TatD family nuclease-associated radical SAM protein [Clostridiales bacterium]
MDTYLYEMDGTLYLNITNDCSNHCEFCIRNNRGDVRGYDLWLEKPPVFADMKAAIDAYTEPYSEAVFCGYGEPTYNIETLVQTGKYLKSLGKRVRLNTNGQGRLINDRDIVPELVGAIDEVSVSLNEAERLAYQQICHPKFGMLTHDEIIDFAKSCKAAGIQTRFSVVDTIPNESIRRCRKIADSVGVPLLVRRRITDNVNYL